MTDPINKLQGADGTSVRVANRALSLGLGRQLTPDTALAQLDDVDIVTTPPTDKQVLEYNATDKKWKAAAAPVTGYTKAEVDTKVAAAAVKVRALTKSAYQSLALKDPQTIYLIIS
jgi:hypothetical protein